MFKISKKQENVLHKGIKNNNKFVHYQEKISTSDKINFNRGQDKQIVNTLYYI